MRTKKEEVVEDVDTQAYSEFEDAPDIPDDVDEPAIPVEAAADDVDVTASSTAKSNTDEDVDISISQESTKIPMPGPAQSPAPPQQNIHKLPKDFNRDPLSQPGFAFTLKDLRNPSIEYIYEYHLTRTRGRRQLHLLGCKHV